MADNDYNKTEIYVKQITAHQMQVYSYIISLVPNYSDADDILQKTWKTIWEQFEKYRPGTDFVAWAISIANFKVLEYWRSEKRNSKIVFNDDVFQKLEQDARIYSEDLNKSLGYLQECIKKLSKADFKIIKMKYYQNLNIRDISCHFGKSIYTIYRHLGHIHNKLYSCISRSMLLEEQQ